MCAGIVALQRDDLLFREEVAHRRIHVLVRAADVVPARLQHRREGRHRRPADANQVNPLHHATAASSRRAPARLRPMTRARTPKGSVMQAPFV